MDILIGQQEISGLADGGTRPHSGAIGLEHDNTVGCDRGEKCQAIGEGRPSGVVVEREVGQGITKDGQEESEMATEPRTVLELAIACADEQVLVERPMSLQLQSGYKLGDTFAQRRSGWRRGCHCVKLV